MNSFLRHTPIVPTPGAFRGRNKHPPGSLRVGFSMHTERFAFIRVIRDQGFCNASVLPLAHHSAVPYLEDVEVLRRLAVRDGLVEIDDKWPIGEPPDRRDFR